jgi:putative transposase
VARDRERIKLFDTKLSLARSRYLRYVEEGMGMGYRKDLIGGGLIRSQGGWTVVKKQRSAKEYQKGDERILGDSDFVEKVLKQSAETLERRDLLQSKGYDSERVVARIAYLLQIPPDEVLAAGKKRLRVTARSLFCLWMSNELGISQVQLANQLNLSQAAVSLAVERGRKFAREQNFTLVD